jgi:hypothetical protein
MPLARLTDSGVATAMVVVRAAASCTCMLTQQPETAATNQSLSVKSSMQTQPVFVAFDSRTVQC